jgi:hypothetical protein
VERGNLYKPGEKGQFGLQTSDKFGEALFEQGDYITDEKSPRSFYTSLKSEEYGE